MIVAEADTQFWHDVAQAHAQVSANHDLSVTVARAGYEAKVTFVPLQATGQSAILILVSQQDTVTREPLPVPGKE